jgi:hypothetical protein
MMGPRMKRRSHAALEALEGATLEELQLRFPDQWIAVGEALVTATATRRPEALAAFLLQARDAAQPWRARLQRPRASASEVTKALPHLARARMAKLAAEQVLRAASVQLATVPSGVDQPDVLRLGLWSGMLIQRLMFSQGLQRKPVSMRAFRWVWPLIPDRRKLMPLVQPKGIYCFYSRELVAALAALVAERTCLEVAAGDGTLARFLRGAGVDLRATDDQSWAHAVTYPPEVERLDAVAALQRIRPAAVICSFPPPGNHFEREILRAPSVELYIVVTTRHRFAAGDQSAYEQQTGFTWGSDPRLARLVLPMELDPDVLVFRRHAPASLGSRL